MLRHNARHFAGIVGTACVILFAVAVVVVSFTNEREDTSLESLNDVAWSPSIGSGASNFFNSLKQELVQEKVQKKEEARKQMLRRATDVLQVAPPASGAKYSQSFSIRGVVGNPGMRQVDNGQSQELVELDDKSDDGATNARVSMDGKTDDAIYSLAEEELLGKGGSDSPFEKDDKAKAVNHISLAQLEKKLGQDRAKEQADEKALLAAKNKITTSLASVQKKISKATAAINQKKKRMIARHAVRVSSKERDGATTALNQALKNAAAKLNRRGGALKRKSNKKGGKADSEIHKTANLMRQVDKLLGKHNPRASYVRPMSTALVARELGEAIDQHERCRRKLEVAEHNLMAVEEKAKTAMREARDADAGMAKSLKMVKDAEDLVEQARQEHENYVQDVRDSLDVRNQYTTEAMQVHTLLEHMNRLKNRYDKAVKVLTQDQLKYNTLLRKIEQDTDKRANLEQDVRDEKAELMMVNTGSASSDDDGLSLSETSPKDQELAEEPFEEADKIMNGIDTNGNRGESKIQRLQSTAQVLATKAKAMMSSLPLIEKQARAEKKKIHMDNQLLIEAENDRVLVKNRLDEGGLSQAQQRGLEETVERDTQRAEVLRRNLLMAKAQLRAERKAETMGPKLEEEAGKARQRAYRVASSAAGRQFRHGFSAFGLGSVAAAAVSPDLAKQVAAEVMRMSVSSSKLKQNILKNTQMLATANDGLDAVRADARQLRSEMEIKRQIANDARKDYIQARNQYEHALRKEQPLEAELHDRSKGVLESRQNAEVALQKAQQHLVATRRTARFAAQAKIRADRYLRKIRKLLYDKQEVVKNLAQCQRGAWSQIQDLTDDAKLHRVIGDGDSDMNWTSPQDLMNSAA